MSVELPPREYYAGLLDALGRVRFNIKRDDSDGTFSTRPSVRIRTKDNDYIISLVGEFLEAHDIDFDLFSRTHGFDYFNVHQASDLAKLHSLLEGESTQLIRELEFTLGPYTEEFDMAILEPADAYRLITAVDELYFDVQLSPLNWHPSPEEVAEEFELDSHKLPHIDIPHAEFREDYPIEYVAGIFDGLAYFRLAIGRSSYGIGYSTVPQIRVYRRAVHPAFALAVVQGLERLDLQFSNVDDDMHTLNTVVNGAEAIDGFAPVVGPYLIAKHEDLAFLHSEIIPRFNEGEHRTKQGLYEIVVQFQPLSNKGGVRNKARRFTPEYFEELWEGEIDPATVSHDDESVQ